jgi:hypothetical protein
MVIILLFTEMRKWLLHSTQNMTHIIYRKINSPRMKQMYATTAHQNAIADPASMPYARKYLLFWEDALGVRAWIVIAALLLVPFTRPAPGDAASATSHAH